MTAYENLYWWSNDGLRLHARDYPGDPALPPLICLPGLTRNARDFEGVAQRFAGRRRVIAVDMRGRGESAYAKDPMSYVPLTYVQDIEALLAEAGIGRFVAIGTSLGGIVTMLMAGPERGRIAGAVLNDIGPEIEAAGLARIRGYVGRASSFPTWMHAARCVAENHGDSYPGWDISDWLGMAKRLYRLTGSGRIVLDYDLKIAEPFRVPGAEAGPDMWQALAALAGVPVLVVRGGRSDILSAGVAERMAAALPDAELVTVPEVGHAPTLTEPPAVAAIERLLARVAA
ncbi:alpha/beta fold hydrolase [Sphingomonas carotinifaciens]|uniref:Alpha/beta fold hydrolase n=1 Tax=Sphingomonas carotinifaciens TaxID=1166323 RepID=A0A1G7KE44_9SPHN|nr:MULTISPECIES: alpha/beta hydrolase [Sphingomonas]MBB4085230.1 pimeloyl-ACP methyl ester carboxylesterase [Sphingomonas carotinifaciens]MWC43745.1 alpha/beta fold hydrolase [Sphingomonas carotinifaciens]SDF35264.1 Pimeloyl-ACP methyl ester carboxylesterase [Sphingomonas carotinifaciens]